jgi:hypothetical protein
LLVSDPNFKVLSGTPKKWAKTADSGQTITSFFCGNCGSTLYRESGSFPGTKIVKGGTAVKVDSFKPTIELYAAERVKWQPEIQGADQKTAMS